MERDAAAHCVGPQGEPGMLRRMTTKEKELQVLSRIRRCDGDGGW